MKSRIVVEKLISHIDKILGYCKDFDYEQFCGNSQLAEACVFNLSQMGELTNRVDEEFAEAHSEIPWHSIYGLRNRIVHDYDGVNLKLIWEIIEEDLPSLKKELEKIK